MTIAIICMKNKKVLIAIFSHPDDEAFGPAGTLAKYAQTHDVYIICATKGESGQNHSKDLKSKIADIRSQEMLESAQILGIKQVFFLDFLDGTLNNNLYHIIAEKIQKIIEKLDPEILLTYEPRGVSGHIDHVVMSMVTNYVFDRCNAKTLMMYCLNQAHRQEISNYFIYFPKGYLPAEINKTVDINDVWETKLKAMHKHHSQQKDIDRILPRLQKLPKEEYFLIRTKEQTADN